MHADSTGGFLKKHYETLATVLFDLFLLWVVVRFALGGWDTAIRLLPHQGPMFWVELFVMVSLVLIKSNFKYDIPLYLSAVLLAYWGEWWGTSRGVWGYPYTSGVPTYVFMTWGVCLLNVYHLYLIVRRLEGEKERKVWSWIKILSLFALPVIGLIILLANDVFGALLYRRERVASYMAWSGAALVQVFFLLALWNIVI